MSSAAKTRLKWGVVVGGAVFILLTLLWPVYSTPVTMGVAGSGLTVTVSAIVAKLFWSAVAGLVAAFADWLRKTGSALLRSAIKAVADWIKQTARDIRDDNLRRYPALAEIEARTAAEQAAGCCGPERTAPCCRQPVAPSPAPAPAPPTPACPETVTLDVNGRRATAFAKVDPETGECVYALQAAEADPVAPKA